MPMEAENKIIKPRIYLAGPLFSLAERTFNHNLKKLLTPYFDVYLPQEDGGLMVDMIREGMDPKLAAQKVFDGDIKAMEKCDVFLMILDGRAVDEGASFELGFSYSHNKPCYGLKTDPRQLLATGNNPMIDCPLEHIFQSIDELVDWARSLVEQKERLERNTAQYVEELV